MRKYVAELIGTFALVFCGTGAIIINEQTNGVISHIGIAMTFGIVIMIMIYSLGNISGAHFNPAVTIAFAAGKKFAWREVPPYLIAQLLGAFIATSFMHFLFPENEMLGTNSPSGSDMQGFIMEIILSFFLMFVIINVSQGSKEVGMFAGIAIGGTILVDALFGGPVTGASMNPARSLAPAVISGHLTHVWIYILAPVTGALIATIVCSYLKPWKI